MANKVETEKLLPGDVLIVGMGIWIIRVLIWIQAILTGKAKYRQDGHVIVITHRDERNRLWGIEGRPGGIGWVLVDKYEGKFGLSNWEQPKTDMQRLHIVDAMKALLGTKYDYVAYIEIALQTMGINTTWTDFQGNDVPSHFICSAVADYVYEVEKMPNPGGYQITRITTPAEWGLFIDKKQWENE